MINFIDEKGVKHSAVVECKKTKGVNGEKSLSGTIYTNDEILEGIGCGWRLEFENEKYCLTYVYPIDEGNRIVVEFDAVHEFFFDLNKKVVYSELNGSNTAKAYLDLIFNGSGYSYVIEVNIPAFEKEGFGMRNQLDLFKEFISDTGVEFSVSGKVVRILEKVGSNLSTIVKKGFNLNELRIEKDPGSFITYKKGFGAWHDDDDHSKGRLEVEYLSPLASVYGKLEGDPIIDERYKVASNFETRLKNDVELSYGISVDIDMEDLTKAGYEYEQPHEGDYIMAINKDLGFEQKIRIMSYETSYDTDGNIIDHKVACGSDNIIRKSIKEDDDFRKEIQAGLEGAISTSNKAWVSANGKNAVFEGPNEPTATAIGDTWFQIDGDKKIMRIWNGYEWNPFFNPGVIEETIKDLDEELGLTTTTANDAVNKAEQAIRDVGFANSAIEAADGKISSLEQNLDGFQQVVQNTYADKTTVTALATQWTQTTELANGHTSQISSLGEQLNLRVTTDDFKKSLGLKNLIVNSGNLQNTLGWSGEVVLAKHVFYKNNTANLFCIRNATTGEKTASSSHFNILPSTEYTLKFTGFAGSNVKDMDVWFLSRKKDSSASYDKSKLLITTNLSPSGLDTRTVTFTTNDTDDQAFLRFDNNGSTNGNESLLFFVDVMLVKGSVAPNDWFNADADDIITQINLSPESLLIASKKIYIDGETYITNGVIKTAHIADLAVDGAKIANATIGSAKIINVDASKITANTLSAITTNTGALNVSGNLTMTNDNTRIIGSFAYGESASSAYNPRYFEGDSSFGRRFISFTGDVYNATTTGGKGTHRYYSESFFGHDYFKLRAYSSNGGALLSRVDGNGNGIEIGNSWGPPTISLTNGSVSALRFYGGRIDTGPSFNTLVIGEVGNIAGVQFATSNIYFNSSRSDLADFRIGLDGNGRVVQSRAVYNRTYSSAANMFVTDSGTIGRSVSARKYKMLIEDSELLDKAKNFLQIKPKNWYDKAEVESVAKALNQLEDIEPSAQAVRHHGFIADELDEIGLNEVVQYGIDGQVEGLAYDRLTIYYHELIKDLYNRIEVLENGQTNSDY